MCLRDDRRESYYRTFGTAGYHKAVNNNRAWAKKNAEQVAEYHRSWELKNKEKRRKQKHLYYLVNRERILEKNRQWKLVNRKPKKKRSVHIWRVMERQRVDEVINRRKRYGNQEQRELGNRNLSQSGLY
jgi:hypothetical protein